MITREAFFALRPEVKEVQVPALGDAVYVKQLTVGEMNRLHIESSKEGGLNFSMYLIVTSVCDADGVRVFNDDDVDRVSGLPTQVFTDVLKAAVAVNKLSEDDVKDLEKN
ncbi:hypothetical protein [Paludisphaera borealis]|uniref:Phage tail assembly chaperone n=1 Tax=Paludisphaera borealis TaxID=1387353 RepID=A0A1U7CNI3_9BACT|nr:hypothetical protein [Paludisphaera borealis]APW60487.1 hypothetical protein BSF38_01957 [Paludisphaera borealis]